FLPRARLPPRSTLLPYTTLFRSRHADDDAEQREERAQHIAANRSQGEADCLPEHQAASRFIVSEATFPSRKRIVRCAYAAMSASDRKSTRLNSSHVKISYAVFCL